MRLEIDSTPAIVPSAEVLADLTPDHPHDSGYFLDTGIKAAQAGDRAGARTALLRCIEIDPGSESAWLWLASISEYPEELLVFLGRVLEINPENARALEWQSATNTLLSKTFVQRGIDAADSGQKDIAAEYFGKALEFDDRNAMGWMWMASLAESNDGRLLYIEKALSIEPENEAAQNALNTVREEIIQRNLADARSAAVEGNISKALDLLNAVSTFSPEMAEPWRLRALFSERFEDKLAAFVKLSEIDPTDPFASANLEYVKYLASLMPQVFTDEAVDAVTDHEPDSMAMSEVHRLEDEVPTERTPTQDLVMPEGVAEAFAETTEASPIVAEIPEHFVSEIPAFVESEYASAESLEVSGEFSPVELAEPIQSESFVELEAAYELAANENVDETEPVDEHQHEVSNGSFDDGAIKETVTDYSNGHDTESEFDPYSTIYSSSLLDVIVPETPIVTTWETPETVEYSFETAQSVEFDGASPEHFEPVVDEPSAYSAEPSESVVDVADVHEFETAPSQEQEAELFVEVAEPAWQPDPEDSFAAGIPMPEMSLEEPVPQVDKYATRIVPSEESARAATICAYCGSANEPLAISCQACMAVLTLSDLEMLLSNQHVDRGLMRSAVESLESDRASRPFGESELTILGIGHLNLRNFDEGFKCLTEAAALNPNNVVLGSQVNALNIRLNEIRAQEEAHSTMSRGKTILVVDDSPTILKLIAGKLEKCGHDVYCSGDGEQAMERLQELRPDLVLLDINMPKMDGYQVCKLIRSNEAIKDIPVVMISGKDGFFDKVRGKMAGTSGYITKPFGPETLMKVVEGYLQGQPAELD